MTTRHHLIPLRELVREGDAYRFLLAEADLGVLVLAGVIEDCNEAACSLFGCSREALIGTDALELSPPVQPDGTRSAAGAARRLESALAGLPQWFEWRFRNLSGEPVDTIVHVEAVLVDGRRRVLLRLRNLSQLQRAESKLRETELRLQQILDNSTNALVYAKDRSGRYLFVNRAFERLVGIPAEDIVGKTPTDLFAPDLAERLMANDMRAIDERRAIEVEEQIDVDGELRTEISNKFPLLDRDGTPYAVCGISVDITARTRVEQAMRRAALAVSAVEGEGLFGALVRSLAEILAVDIAFIALPSPTDANKLRMLAFCVDGRMLEDFEYDIAGTPCETVVGQQYRIYPSCLTERFPLDADFRNMGADAYAGYPLTGPLGRSLGLISVVSRRPLADPELVEAMLMIFATRAVTEIERRRADEALRASEAQYRAIFNASTDALVLRDAEFRIVDVNSTYEAWTGISREQAIGADRVLANPPGVNERVKAMHGRVLAGEPIALETQLLHRDGSFRELELRGMPIRHRGAPHVLYAGRDITQRKRAESERQALEAQLRQAQKMEAIGLLTGGIAHDFNNILTSILGYIVLAGERDAAAADPKLLQYLEQAQRASLRARDLIQQMLTFSRGTRGEPRPLDLPSLVRDGLKLIGATLPSTMVVDVHLDREVPAVMADPVQAEQVLLNLLINARDAMTGTGAIDVRVELEEHAGLACASCRKPIHGPFVALAVRDSGCGIAPEAMDRIFDPFFTTKGVGKGSGMGLSMVHGLVHECGGHVIVDSALGAGTTFRVLFPPLADARADAGAAASTRSEHTPHAPRISGRVLVVDDEPMVGEFVAELLASRGLDVTVKSDPLEAARWFSESPDRVDLVLTDQTMPRMTGLELAQQLTSERPELPVILYTGYSEDLGAGELRRHGVSALLKKPIEPAALVEVLRSHLPQA